jgi:hypothetical protein
MSSVIWQDGFEYTGGATLSSVYGTGYLSGSIVTGGRSGGHALNGAVSVATGLSAGAPVVVGYARNGGNNRAHVNLVGPTGTLLATLSVDTFGRVGITFPTASTAVDPVAGPPLNEGWYYLEVQCLIATSGRVIVGIDGLVLFDVSLNTGTQAIAKVELWSDGALVDDWYVASPGLTPDFQGDWSVGGTPPATVGGRPSLTPAAVTQQLWGVVATPPPASAAISQQYWIEGHVAPKVHAAVSDQYWIVAIKNKKPAKPRPQVFG